MLKRQIFHLAKSLGYEIRGERTAFGRQRALASLLREMRISLVLDVGANAGQFASEIREYGYAGRIVSFEPIPAIHAQLVQRAKGDRNWTVADRTAIGAEKGTVEFHISEDTVSSSILDILPAALEAEPRARYDGKVMVPLNRLDDLCPPSTADRVLLKVDVQGYEEQVLQGAPNIVKNAIAVQIELSTIPLYDGQIGAKELLRYFLDQGFDIWSMEPVLRQPDTLRLLQLDAIFARVTA